MRSGSPGEGLAVASNAGDPHPRIASLARFIEYWQSIELSDRLWDR